MRWTEKFLKKSPLFKDKDDVIGAVHADLKVALEPLHGQEQRTSSDSPIDQLRRMLDQFPEAIRREIDNRITMLMRTMINNLDAFVEESREEGRAFENLTDAIDLHIESLLVSAGSLKLAGLGHPISVQTEDEVDALLRPLADSRFVSVENQIAQQSIHNFISPVFPWLHVSVVNRRVLDQGQNFDVYLDIKPIDGDNQPIRSAYEHALREKRA